MAGIGDMVGKLGIIGIIANQALEFLGKIVGFLAQTSPALRNVSYQMSKAMMIFFRPFGDFLASLLRPLARSWLKMSREWLKFTRMSPEEQAAAIIDPMKKRVETLFSGMSITDIIQRAGSIWDVIENKTKPIWDYVQDIFRPIWYYVSDFFRPIWYWIQDKFQSIWTWVFESSTDSKSIWNWILPPIGSQVKSIWDFITGGGGTTTTTGGGSYTVTNGAVTSTSGTITTTDIKNAVNAAVSAASSVYVNAFTGVAGKNPFQDFIWRSGSKPQTISSSDTIVGTKGGQEKSINLGGITVNVARMDSRYDAKQMANDVADQVINKLRSM
jgi:hypothetical protein